MKKRTILCCTALILVSISAMLLRRTSSYDSAFVSPTEQSKKEVNYYLKSIFPQGETVYWDKSHKLFYSDNRFLRKDEQFNMFLLDKDDRVICIGNSLAGNKELGDLYIKRIKEYLGAT